MSQTATSETATGEMANDIDAFRERVRELREKLERAQGAPIPAATPVAPSAMPAARAPAPREARTMTRPAAPAHEMAALPAAIEQRMMEATHRIEQMAAREQDLTSLLRRTRSELETSERDQAQALEELRIAEERVRAAEEDTEQSRAVAEGLRQQVEAQRKRVEALSAENRALQSRNEKLNADAAQASQRENSAREELGRLQATFDALQVSYDEVRRQKGDLEQNLTRTTGRINEFETELMAQLQHLEAEYARIEGEANASSELAGTTEAERARLESEVASRDALIDELRGALDAGEAKRQDDAEKRRAIDGKLETMQEELSGLQSRYAADLVELDTARQNASRFERRAADLTEELQAYRKMQQQHESAFAQMDSLFRSLDAKKPEASSEATSKADAAPQTTESVRVQTAATVQPVAHAASAPAQPRARVVSVQAPKAQPCMEASVVKRDAPAPTETEARAAEQSAARAAISKDEAAKNARERLGKSLEALQALATKRRPEPKAAPVEAPAAPAVAESAAPVPSAKQEAASEQPAQPTPAQAPAQAEAQAAPEAPVATQPASAPVVEPVDIAEVAAAPAGNDRMAGFIMPKPRLITPGQ